MIGLTLAKACSQPGKVATGTNVELVKISGMTASSPPMPADSGSRTSSPSSAKIHEKATPTARASPIAASAAGGAGVEPEPDRVADAGHQGQDEQVADGVCDGAAGQDGGAGHRQCPEPVDHAGGQVVGEATPVWEAPNAMARTQIPGSA